MHFLIILQAINIDHLKVKTFHESKKVRLVDLHEVYDNAFAQIIT